MMRIEHEDFGAALAEARAMTDSELKKAARAGASSSYYIQDGERQIPMKAVLRLAYIRIGQTWDGPQSKEAFEYLRGMFPVVYRPTAEALAEDEKRERVWVERLARGEQANFRRALITRDGACVLTGFSVLRALERFLISLHRNQRLRNSSSIPGASRG